MELRCRRRLVAIWAPVLSKSAVPLTLSLSLQSLAPFWSTAESWSFSKKAWLEWCIEKMSFVSQNGELRRRRMRRRRISRRSVPAAW